MPYQSFNVDGDSNSSLKYSSLKLDSINIKGKTCLDIGCNEGYFCHKMIECGATSCVGIDSHKETIEKANSRIKTNNYNIQYLHLNIDDYSTNNKYDIVLISSALHYMNASNIIPKIASILNKDGIFVFEGGILMDRNDNEWVKIKRARDIVTHPTRNAFETLVKQYFKKVVLIGPSVFQQGDPINRYVYHCYL